VTQQRRFRSPSPSRSSDCPFLLLGPYAAALADLAHRRTLVVGGNVLRAGVLLVLALALATGHAPSGALLTALLVLGVSRPRSCT
jgi:hypothetical protein